MQKGRFHGLTSSSHLIPAHGGQLCELIAVPERIKELKSLSKDWPSWDLTTRQVCDLELLLSGGFSPLRGFMNRAEYESVCQNMQLPDGPIWPMPITLDISEEFAKRLKPGSSKIALMRCLKR
jgi:sulfate adenylyltransferase